MRLQTFSISCVPPTATSQQKGAFVCGGKVRFFKKGHVKQAENTLLSLFAPHAPPVPHDGPLRVTFILVFPWRKSELKRTLATGITPHATRPDFDNLSKMLCDTMTTLRFWADDGAISDGRVIKRRGNDCKIAVLIERDDTDVHALLMGLVDVAKEGV